MENLEEVRKRDIYNKIKEHQIEIDELLSERKNVSSKIVIRLIDNHLAYLIDNISRYRMQYKALGYSDDDGGNNNEN